MMNFIAGMLLSAVVAIISIRKNKLTPSAGLTAIAVGTLIYAWVGWETWFITIIFFVSASVTSRIGRQIRHNHANSHARKVGQVLANGLPAVIFALIYYLTENTMTLLSAASAIACATADTWSSDIGILSKQKTVSVLTFRQIKAGQSGGISLIGCISSILGSMFIAGIYVALRCFSDGNEGVPLTASFFIIISCGIIGSFVDSVLGASIQSKYLYENKIIEFKENQMENAILMSGFRTINNDVVNLLSGFIAGGVSIALYLIFVR